MRTILFSKLTVGFVGITVLALLLATVNLYQTSALSSPTSAKSIDTNYTLEDRDPNETNEIIQIYWNGIILMRENNWDNAKSWFEINLLSYPDSRHLHEGLAEVLWYLANNKPTDTSLLESASGEIIRAVTIGFDFGKVRHTWLLAQILGRSGNTNTLDNIFKQALLIDPAYTTYLHYAFGLTILNDSRAEVIYKQAIELQPEGNVDGLASYGEWLLDHHRYSEVIVLLPKDAHIEYLHFLRGVAFEQLKLIDDAKSEYAQFIEFSMIFPAPIQYRIKGSIAQTGIHFEGDLFINVTEIQARVGLSTLIYGEASGESTGGQRAEGWVVRNRVLRGSVGGCPYVENGGATLADKYKSVMCQSGQFDGMCSAWCSNPATTSCPHSTTTDHNASDVWYGYAPDPVKSGGYCPGGYKISTCPDGICEPCNGVVHCWGGTTGYSTQGGLFNYGTPGSCPLQFIGPNCPPTCRGKVCGNGGSDNCFYTNP